MKYLKEKAVNLYAYLQVSQSHSYYLKFLDPRQKKNINRDFGMVSLDHHICSFLWEDNYSLTQFMTQNVPNLLLNTFYSPSSTF